MAHKPDIAAGGNGAEETASLLTRASLLSRLQDLENQEGWQEFFPVTDD